MGRAERTPLNLTPADELGRRRCAMDPSAAPAGAPEGFVDCGGEVEVFRTVFPSVDTSKNTCGNDMGSTGACPPLSLGVVGAGAPRDRAESGFPEVGAHSMVPGGACDTSGDDEMPGEETLDECGDWDPECLCAGWTFDGSRRRRKQRAGKDGPSQRGSPTAGKPLQHAANNAKLIEERRKEAKAQHVARINNKMARDARMPQFGGKDDHRVVIRPRGGFVAKNADPMLLRKAIIAAAKVGAEEAAADKIAVNVAQNVLVVSTPSESRSFRYGALRYLTVGDCTYEAFAYKSAPSDTMRGVIKGVGLDDSAEEITRALVNDDNPSILAAHRLGQTGSVVILFDGNRVPFHVYYEGVLMKCTLYRQHKEVCATCGQVGHRRDVCPTPLVKICFACGRKNPDAEHNNFCKPRCRLCGGSHTTGAGSCKNKFKTPLLIRQRQMEKRESARPQRNNNRWPENSPAEQVRTPPGAGAGRQARIDKNKEKGGSNPSITKERSRSKSAGRKHGLSWADITSENGRRRERSQSRNRSKSRERSQSRKRTTPGEERVTGQGEETRTTRKTTDEALPNMKPGIPQRIQEKKSKTEDPAEYICAKERELRKVKAQLQKSEAETQRLATLVESLQKTVKQMRQERLRDSGYLESMGCSQPKEDAEERSEGMNTDNEAEEPPPRVHRRKRPTKPTAEEQQQSQNMEQQHADTEHAYTNATPEGDERPISREEENRQYRTPGYAGLQARLTRLENIYKKWDRNLEEMEKRIINKNMHHMQQMLNQALEQHTERISAMLQERLDDFRNSIRDGSKQEC